MTEVLEIRPYDPDWAGEFKRERARLQTVLGAIAVRIDHHGSTSVPGLAAKPVIDIQISVHRLQPLSAYAVPLESAGYVHLVHPDDSFAPFFYRPGSWPHTHHVHVVEAGGEEERKTLAFRDYLREHPETAREYEALKRELASKFDSHQAYAEAKGEFIAAVTCQALAEAVRYASPSRKEPSTSMIQIREYQESDWPALWPILRITFEAGDTYTFSPQSSEAEIHRAWIEVPAATFVACEPDGQIVGTYFIKPNQPGLGSHVSNCGYVVAPQAQGKGIAAAMCEHSQTQAIAMGFRAMQFNFVVYTNERAVRLWQRLGFSVVGRLPCAFRHQQLGYVDALVMFKQLVT